MTDEEVVRVGLAPNGAVQSVVVDQTLTIDGLGDFELKVLGPVQEVDAPPEQSPQPGLRRTTVLWSGFSPGRKVLRSTLTMDATAESVRLPIAVTAVNGSVTLRNQTTLPAAIDVGPAEVRSLVNTVRSRLAAGQDPFDGLPPTIPATGPVAEERLFITVPVRVVGTVGTTPVDVVVADAPVSLAASGEVRLRATAATPTLAPDAGLRELHVALTQAARKADLDVFIGVTAPGPSSTVYEYGPAAAPPPPPPPPEDLEPNPVAIALALAAALASAVLARAVWLRS